MAITLSIVKWDILTPYYPRISSEEVGCFQGVLGTGQNGKRKKKKKMVGEFTGEILRWLLQIQEAIL